MLAVWFAILQLHNLSRLHGAYVVLVVLATALLFLVSLRARLDKRVFVWVAINVAVLAYLTALEIFLASATSMANLVKLATPFAVMILFSLAISSLDDVRRISRVFLVIVLISAMTMFYQVFAGPIWWFAEASERAGVVRYSSLLGSLTIFGTAVPFALLCLARYERRTLLLVGGGAILLASAILSLQKAAFLGLAIALPFVVLLLSRSAIVLACAMVAVVATIVSAFLPVALTDYMEVGMRYFFDPEFETGDVAIGESLLDRLFNLPIELINTYGAERLMIGVGLRGGGGIFGQDDLPMAHNGIVDFLAIGGVIFLAYGLFVVYRIVALLGKIPRLVRVAVISRNDGIFLAGVAVLYLANLPFSSGLQFQPNIGWTAALLVAVSGLVDRPKHEVRSSVSESPSGQAREA